MKSGHGADLLVLVARRTAAQPSGAPRLVREGHFHPARRRMIPALDNWAVTFCARGRVMVETTDCRENYAAEARSRVPPYPTPSRPARGSPRSEEDRSHATATAPAPHHPTQALHHALFGREDTIGSHRIGLVKGASSNGKGEPELRSPITPILPTRSSRGNLDQGIVSETVRGRSPRRRQVEVGGDGGGGAD